MSIPMLGKLLTDPMYGPIVDLFVKQQLKGVGKYGELLSTDRVSLIEFIEHAQQEMMDGLIYLEGIKQHLQKEQSEPKIEHEHLKYCPLCGAPSDDLDGHVNAVHGLRIPRKDTP